MTRPPAGPFPGTDGRPLPNEPLTASALWTELAPRWPNREASRFVRAGATDWHVQTMGSGPVALLLHGTGAATHSWRGLLPRLAERWTVVAPDLPGHGFTSAPPTRRLSIEAMAEAVSALLETLGASPALVVGHSAGAAVLVRMTLDGRIAPRTIVGINAALSPPALLYRLLVAPLLNPIALSTFALRLAGRVTASGARLREILASTGSSISNEQFELYAALFRDPGHTASVLAMLASWDLAPLEHELPRVNVPVTLLAGTRDRWVPLESQELAARRFARAALVRFEGLGHLAHEEAPDTVAGAISDAAADAGVPAGRAPA